MIYVVTVSFPKFKSRSKQSNSNATTPEVFSFLHKALVGNIRVRKYMTFKSAQAGCF
jgi:hypothetical protein